MYLKINDPVTAFSDDIIMFGKLLSINTKEDRNGETKSYEVLFRDGNKLVCSEEQIDQILVVSEYAGYAKKLKAMTAFRWATRYEEQEAAEEQIRLNEENSDSGQPIPVRPSQQDGTSK